MSLKRRTSQTKLKKPSTIKKRRTNYDKYLNDVDLWESKKLGASAKYAKRASAKDDTELDEALGLAPITIRLQKELVEDLKSLSKREGLGYQPFIRQILTRYVRQNKR